MNTKVFSPIVQSSLPAQVVNIENFILKIPFEVPSLVNISNVKHMQVIVIDQQTNKYISIPINDFTTPDKVYYTNNFNDSFIQVVPTALKAGHLYKIQIRFGYCDLWGNDNQFVNWKQTAIENGDFSEWSNVMIVKCLSNAPSFATGLNKSPTNILTPNFYGLATFNSADEEYVDKYKFTLKYQNNILEETDWLTYIPIEPYYSIHKFKTILEKGATYEITYSIISQNGYTASVTESVIAGANLFLELADATIQVTSDNENARNIVTLNNLKLLQQYTIVRASEDTNYKIWEDVYSFQQQNNDSINYSDFTIASGIQYKYGIQKIDSLGNRSNILEAEGICQTYFEYTYLVHDNKQLKLKFDTKLSSFKHTVLASKQDTLGSKYPTILRNGNAYYAEFPINGLISFNMDDFNTFWDQSVDAESKTDLTHNNIQLEKQFRDKVEAFLNDGGYKLFKSATEGNLIITLMNIVLTPNTALGRMIYSFSATAYEVAEANLDNMHKLGIITNGNIASTNDTLYLGDTIIFDPSEMNGENLFESYPAELDTNLEIIEWPSSVITNLSSDSISCQIDGVSITIKSGRQYICPIPIAKELIINDNSDDSNVTIDYTYSVKIRSVVETLYEYGAETMWGQIEANTQEEPNNLYDKLLKLVAEKLELDQSNINDNVKLEFTVLRFDGTEGDHIKINDTEIVLNKTGIWNLPTPMQINSISILESTNLILMDYYCIINWKKEIIKEE